MKIKLKCVRQGDDSPAFIVDAAGADPESVADALVSGLPAGDYHVTVAFTDGDEVLGMFRVETIKVVRRISEAGKGR